MRYRIETRYEPTKSIYIITANIYFFGNFAFYHIFMKNDTSNTINTMTIFGIEEFDKNVMYMYVHVCHWDI